MLSVRPVPCTHVSRGSSMDSTQMKQGKMLIPQESSHVVIRGWKKWIPGRKKVSFRNIKIME